MFSLSIFLEFRCPSTEYGGTCQQYGRTAMWHGSARPTRRGYSGALVSRKCRNSHFQVSLIRHLINLPSLYPVAPFQTFVIHLHLSFGPVWPHNNNNNNNKQHRNSFIPHESLSPDCHIWLNLRQIFLRPCRLDGLAPFYVVVYFSFYLRFLALSVD